MQLAVLPQLRRPLRPESKPDPLRDRLAAVVESSVVELLDPDRIEALAEDMRLLQRRRVHHVGLVACALVLSALERSTDTQGRLLDAQRVYEALGGPVGAPSGFRTQARKAGRVLQRLLHRRLSAMAQSRDEPELRGRLAAFRDVLVPDGCAFKLARALCGLYPGTGQQAELKLHAVYSVRAAGVMSVERTAGSVHDSDGFWPETWQAGALYIWDLAFNSNERFVDAAQSGAHVLQRLKSSANPVVLASFGETGTRRELRDPDTERALRLSDACALGLVHQKRVLDLDVEIRDGKRKVVARVVCVPFGGEDRYYLTTLPRARFTPHDVAELYRLRWEVELFFRSWKGAVRMDEVRPLQHDDSLVAVITASLLAATLAQGIHKALDRMTAERTSHDAASAAFSP